MLIKVPNPHNNLSLARLNKKIEEYQKLDKRELSQKGLLLEEINYMVDALRAQHLSLLLSLQNQSARA